MDRLDNIKLEESTNGLSLQTPGQSSYLCDIRDTVCALARKVGFTEVEVAMIEMSVDEACTNVIQHAYASDAKWCWQHRAPEIRLNMHVENNQLIVEINDHGQKFDYTACFPDSIDERLQAMQTNGYGVSIIRKFMDEIAYISCDTTGNTLRLTKHLPTGQPPTQQEIAARAYELYVQHGRRDGHDRDDWLQAEYELTHRFVESIAQPLPPPLIIEQQPPERTAT